MTCQISGQHSRPGGPRAAGCFAAEDAPVGVVVELHQLRAPPHEHRHPRVEADADRGAEALRPARRVAQRRRAQSLRRMSRPARRRRRGSRATCPDVVEASDSRSSAAPLVASTETTSRIDGRKRFARRDATPGAMENGRSPANGLRGRGRVPGDSRTGGPGQPLDPAAALGVPDRPAESIRSTSGSSPPAFTASDLLSRGGRGAPAAPVAWLQVSRAGLPRPPPPPPCVRSHPGPPGEVVRGNGGPASKGAGCSKSGREDLNLRPPAPKAGALPGCATPRIGRDREHDPARGVKLNEGPDGRLRVPAVRFNCAGEARAGCATLCGA